MNTISIDEVKETYEAQARAAICEKTVAEYADAMSSFSFFSDPNAQYPRTGYR